MFDPRWQPVVANRFGLFAMAITLAIASSACAHRSRCDRNAAVEVLGSGGPIPDDGRASSGYVVWARDRARVLVDVGGGTFVRFAESGARLEDLDAIALTHLHVDHSADLPALLKGAYFSSRSTDLALFGPTQGGRFPGLEAWTRSLFDPSTGAYAYLGWLMNPSEGAFSLNVRPFDAARRQPEVVWSDPTMKIVAVGVEHGPVPALAYRVDVDDHAVVFSGDFNGTNDHLADLAKGADVLVFHHAIPQTAVGVAARLHARPSELGRIAAASGVDRLVLSHHMRRSLAALPASLEVIRREYDGRITVADDHTCIPLRVP